MKFPRDAPQRKVIKTFEALGFKIVRLGNHISMVKENPDGSNTPLTMPNHERIKGIRLNPGRRRRGLRRDEARSRIDY